MKSVRAPTKLCNVPVHPRVTFCLVLLILLFLAATQLTAQTPRLAGHGIYRVLHTFTGGSDGGNPYAGLILDKAGNLYGTTEMGGTYGRGTVFQLTPSGSDWTETVLYSFTGGSDGSSPSAGVIIDDAGNLYGATATGGDNGCSCGTLFQLTPSAGGWTLTTLHTFHGSDGAYPGGTPIFYFGGLSVTTTGGGIGFGTAFTWSRGVYRFNGANGEEPWASLTPDDDHPYGTTFRGGSSGSGKVFELMSWGEIHDIHNFSPADRAGTHPMGNLIKDSAGNLYGTTSYGSAHGLGAVFQMTPSPYYYNTWNMHVLYSFSGLDGAISAAGLVIDKTGNLYGTTTWGGADPGYAGTVFRLAPGTKSWTETLLYSFSGGSDGAEPYAGVVLDDAGNLYGTTYSGGAYNQGVVYEVVNTTAVVKPTSLTFGPQPLHTTSPAQRISLFNKSPFPITVTSVNLQGDFAVSANKCQNGVQPNTHCDVYVTFTPTGTGTAPRTGSITFDDTAFNSPQSAQLSGTVPYPSKTVVTTSGSPSLVGQPVTFTATVTSTHGTIPDGGLVTFYDGTTTLGSVALAGGMAAYTTSSLLAKTHYIKATYAGEAAFEPSTGLVEQVVDKYPTTTALTSNPNPSAYGQAVTFTAVVASTGPYQPTGKVWFKDGTTGIGTVTLSTGVATLTKSTLAAGTHPITAQYLGDAASAKSTSAILNQVVQ